MVKEINFCGLDNSYFFIFLSFYLDFSSMFLITLIISISVSISISFSQISIKDSRNKMIATSSEGKKQFIGVQNVNCRNVR